MNNILVSNWGFSSQLLIDEAKKNGLKTGIILEKKNLFWIEKNGEKIYFKSIDCQLLNSSFGLKASDDKELTYLLADENSIKVPKSIYINKDEINNFNYDNIKIGYPLISKPVDGAHGDGVFLNINSSAQLKKGVNFSFSEVDTNRVVIQEQISGDDHRFLVVGDKVVSVTKRIPPFIIGNGINTINKLIKIENSNQNRGEGHDTAMSYIKFDDELENTVNENGYELGSILEKDKKIDVRKNANLSTGGLAIDVTDMVHSDNITEATKIANILKLKVCGVDIFSSDISKSLNEVNGAIIEVNATPGIRMHHFPSEGKGRNVAKDILDLALSSFK